VGGGWRGDEERVMELVEIVSVLGMGLD